MKNNTMNKWTTITITLIFIFTALFPSITANEAHSVYGYLYINDKSAPSGVMIRLRFPDLCVIGVTNPSGYYQIDFSGFDGETGNFLVSYSEELYIPIDNQSVYIDPNITHHNIDLHIRVTPSIVYVDDDFNISTPGWQIDFFDKIQDGINAVNESGSVFVYNGSYYENIVINKSINLVGENRDNTVIDGGGVGDVVSICSDWVNISGFTIRNSGEELYNAGIFVKKNRNIINNNIILSNRYGIYLFYNSNTIVKENIVTLNKDFGIEFDASNNNSIINNKITNNRVGIRLVYSKNNTIKNNTIIWHSNGSGISDSLSLTPSNIIGNNISFNKKGIYFYQTMYGNITENNISNNEEYGIFGESISSIKIMRNYVSKNNHCAINIYEGDSITIEGNNIKKSEYGLGVYGCSFSIFRKNNFLENGKWNAAFCKSIGNKWISNYWDDWIGVRIKLPIFQRLPKIIWWPGYLPNFDWNPAKEPYDI